MQQNNPYFCFYHKTTNNMRDKIKNLIIQYLLEISKSKLKLQNYASLDLLTDEIINEQIAGKRN